MVEGTSHICNSSRRAKICVCLFKMQDDAAQNYIFMTAGRSRQTLVSSSVHSILKQQQAQTGGTFTQMKQRKMTCWWKMCLALRIDASEPRLSLEQHQFDATLRKLNTLNKCTVIMLNM